MLVETVSFRKKGAVSMANCNETNCICPKTNCERHGKCCECINFHRNNQNQVFCMREGNYTGK